MTEKTDPAIWGRELAEGLNRAVLESLKRREPGADWSEWTLGERTFRVSPDRKSARELLPDGFWNYVVAEYVINNARRSPTAESRAWVRRLVNRLGRG